MKTLKNKYRYFILAVFIVNSLFGYHAYAQPGREIVALANHFGDSVMIRIAPATMESWQESIRNGFIIEKYSIDNHYHEKLFNRIEIQPYPVEYFMNYTGTDLYISMIGELIYNEKPEVNYDLSSNLASIFDVAQNKENRFSYSLLCADISFNAARAAGLGYVDKNVVKGQNYRYKIISRSQKSNADTFQVYPGAGSMPLPKPVQLNANTERNLVILKWSKSFIENRYVYYEIERKDGPLEPFQKINNLPYVPIENADMDRMPFYTYVDTFNRNDEVAYRIKGVTCFGEQGPYSDTVHTGYVSKLYDLPVILKKAIGIDTFYIEWQYPEYPSGDSPEGFIIMQSDVYDAGYNIISDSLNPESRNFRGKLGNNSFYIKVSAFRNDARVSSQPVLIQPFDTIPPAAPKIAFAEIDTNGNVNISWNSNPEPDIYGYRLYRANDTNEEFSLLTASPVKDTFYLDIVNLNTLSENVCYKLMALDKRQNYSKFSESFVIKRPDIIPPASPVLTKIQSDSCCNRILWINSSSKDVKKYILYKFAVTDMDTVEIDFHDTLTCYMDCELMVDVPTKYELVAVDKSGNHSNKSNPLTFVNASCKPGLEVDYRVSRNKSEINLTWKLRKVSYNKFLLYRKKGDGSFIFHASLNGDAEYYTDSKVTPKTDYQYLLKGIDKSGYSRILNKSGSINF